MTKDYMDSDNAIGQRSVQTSYYKLFEQGIEGWNVQWIEIPLIQRDYAQGRLGKAVEKVRSEFLKVLCDAFYTTGESVGTDLDFIYGDLTNDGVFYPLDGQQRLTALFLLHWYVASRAGVDVEDAPWMRVRYATRPSAAEFCQFLRRVHPGLVSFQNQENPSDWLQDHRDYFITWKHDPTIQSMLVVLDALHDLLRQTTDFSVLWNVLTDKEKPAIQFRLLLMKENGLTDDLYVKMNSRGIPLTAFEGFKAYFEGLLKTRNSRYSREFAAKIDGIWADVFWEYKSDDGFIGEQFLRYLRFVLDMWCWKAGTWPESATLEERMKQLVEQESEDALAFLRSALDTWYNEKNGHEQKGFVAEIFAELFTLDERAPASSQVRLFSVPGPDSEKSVDLFGGCVRYYGDREWSYGHSVLLYAVLVARIAGLPTNRQEALGEMRRRLRVVRNLIEASPNELAERQDGGGQRMNNIVTQVGIIMVSGDLGTDNWGPGFNAVQVSDERQKKRFLRDYPELEEDVFRLEDHEVLRGGLTVFAPLCADHFKVQAKAFAAVFRGDPAAFRLLKGRGSEIMGALLAQIGDSYERQWPRYASGTYGRFGASDNYGPWRDLLRRRADETHHPSHKALMALLDKIATVRYDEEVLATIQKRYCEEDDALKDWRYYFIKYPVMRGAPEGAYTFDCSRYYACMLKGTGVTTFWDPYLLALAKKAGYADRPDVFADGWPQKFYGLADEGLMDGNPQRFVKLSKSGIQMKAVKEGWRIESLPQDQSWTKALLAIADAYGVVCKEESEGARVIRTVGEDEVDRIDRIECGAAVLRELVGLSEAM